MTAQEYRDAIAHLGLSQTAAGAFFDVTDRTSRQWSSTGPPVPIEIVLKLMLRYNISVASVERLLGK